MREGVPRHVRDTEAELIVAAELHGVPSHGCLMLPRAHRRIRAGGRTLTRDARGP